LSRLIAGVKSKGKLLLDGRNSDSEKHEAGELRDSNHYTTGPQQRAKETENLRPGAALGPCQTLATPSHSWSVVRMAIRHRVHIERRGPRRRFRYEAPAGNMVSNRRSCARVLPVQRLEDSFFGVCTTRGRDASSSTPKTKIRGRALGERTLAKILGGQTRAKLGRTWRLL